MNTIILLYRAIAVFTCRLSGPQNEERRLRERFYFYQANNDLTLYLYLNLDTIFIERGDCMPSFDKIDALQKKLSSMKPLKAAVSERIEEDFLIRYTYNTNAIEGSTLTEQETYLLLKEDLPAADKPMRYHLDAIGHKEAFLFMKAQAKMGVPASEEFIKAIHTKVLKRDPDVGGQYRNVEVYIGGSDAILASPEQIPSRMKKLVNAFNSKMQDLHIVKRIALFHLEFESIHPFIDGNGRTGRLLINYDLMRNGYPPIDIRFTEKRKYYYCFQAYNGPDENDMPMQFLIAECLENELKDRISIAQQEHGLYRDSIER